MDKQMCTSTRNTCSKQYSSYQKQLIPTTYSNTFVGHMFFPVRRASPLYMDIPGSRIIQCATANASASSTNEIISSNSAFLVDLCWLLWGAGFQQSQCRLALPSWPSRASACFCRRRPRGPRVGTQIPASSDLRCRPGQRDRYRST